MNEQPFSVVILAAGQGTRMRSDRHKVLHPIADKPMLLHLLDTVAGMGAARQVVVVGKGREQIEAALDGRGVTTAVQAEQKGTAHAVGQAREALAGARGPVLILYGDTPFVTAATLRRMLDRLAAADAPGVVVLASSPVDGKSYGRVILGEGDRISKMVEYKDANEAERAVSLCNSGMMAVDGEALFGWLDRDRQRQCGGTNIICPTWSWWRCATAATRWRSRARNSRPRGSTAAPNSRISSSTGSGGGASRRSMKARR